MISDVSLAVVYTHTSISNELENDSCTFDWKGVLFFGCPNFFSKVNGKYYIKLDIGHKIIVPCL